MAPLQPVPHGKGNESMSQGTERVSSLDNISHAPDSKTETHTDVKLSKHA